MSLCACIFERFVTVFAVCSMYECYGVFVCAYVCVCCLNVLRLVCECSVSGLCAFVCIFACICAFVFRLCLFLVS